MPKYFKNKRRRRHNSFAFSKPEHIEMSSKEEKKPKKQTREKQSVFRILNGKKHINKVRRLAFLSVILALFVAFSVIFFSAPTGIGDMFAGISSFSFKSEFPVKLNSSETYNCVLKDSHLYVLSDGDVSCYHKNGKLSFSDAHGFTSPVLCESEARCLVFDQNGNGIRVYNAGKKLLSIESKFSLLAADIGRNGYFAYASKSESYTSMVTVCDDEGKNFFEWYCAEETINGVAVAPNGKTFAVTTLSVSNGKFNSKLYVLGLDSADPIFTKEYPGEIIYGINSVNKKNFVVIGEKFCDIVSWKKHEITTFSTDYCIDGVKATASHIFISSSRENNDGNTSFTVYNNRRKNVFSYTFNGPVDSFTVKGENVFVLSRNNIYRINSKGEVKKQASCGFGVIKIAAVSSTNCLAVGHNEVTKIHLS